MRFCPQCGAPYPDEGRFCPLDGKPLLPPIPAADFSARDTVHLQPRAATASGAPVFHPPASFIGKLIGGRFLVEEEIGQGATALIYRARHVTFGRRVAVKLLRPEFLSEEKALRRFLREAVIAARLDHPHIVRVNDFGRTPEGHAYLVMEHLDGPSLFDVLTAEGPLPLRRALRIAVQLAEALRHAHSCGVIHRDIKPENMLLIERYGQPDWVKVLDLGLAKVLDLPPLSAAGEVFGTPAYLSPEALTGAQQVGAPADVYALGILLHDCLAGSPPFSGDMLAVLQQHQAVVPALLSARRPDLAVPGDLDRLIARLLEKHPAARPTAAQAADELARLLELLGEDRSADALGPVLEALALQIFADGPSPAALLAERRLDEASRMARALLQQKRLFEEEAAEVEHRMKVSIETHRGRILGLEERRAELQLFPSPSGDAAETGAFDQEILRLEEDLDALERTAAAGWHRQELVVQHRPVREAQEEVRLATRDLIDVYARAEAARPSSLTAALRARLLRLRPP